MMMMLMKFLVNIRMLVHRFELSRLMLLKLCEHTNYQRHTFFLIAIDFN